MGSGKTTGIFNLMAEEYSKTNKKFFYVSLFNSEVGDGNKKIKGRIHEDLSFMDFKMPVNRGEGKKENIKDLMKKGYNIATTHASFKSFDKEAVQLMVDGNYTLIIDEALDCIAQYREWTREEISPLIESSWMSVDDAGRLYWAKEGLKKGNKYEEIMKLCDTESLYVYKDEILIWEYPPLLLKSLEDVYILTYLFEGSIMSSWMEKNDIEWKWLPENVLGLKPEEEIKTQVRENLTILKSNNLTKLRAEEKKGENQFSVGWYKRNCVKDGVRDKDKSIVPPTESMERITKIMESCVNRSKVPSKAIFWTTFGDYKKALAGKGFTQTPRDGLPPFLAYNTKATNEYRDHSLCMYGVNVFKSMTEINYLASRGIDFDMDQYSLSEMVQFLFRSTLRQNLPTKVLVLSGRMEEILEEWLYEGGV